MRRELKKKNLLKPTFERSTREGTVCRFTAWGNKLGIRHFGDNTSEEASFGAFGGKGFGISNQFFTYKKAERSTMWKKTKKGSGKREREKLCWGVKTT